MKNLILLLLTISLFSCSSDSKDETEPIVEDNFIRAADMSYLPLIESEGTVYKNNNVSENALTTLKNAG